jgi:hypothetical protein
MGVRESTSATELRYQAASLAFALLRFADGAAHPDYTATPAGMLRTGIDCYIFTPSWKRIAIRDVPRYLADLPSPAILAGTTTRGIASLTLVDELQGDRRAWARKTIDNQCDGLTTMATQLGLDDDSHVLLQFDDEEHWCPMPVIREWCANYAVHVGWNMRPYMDDDRARARLMLIRSDRTMSWGDACPVRRPSPHDTEG